MATLSDIFNWFMTGKRPTQAQFWASWGSFYNKGESIPQSAITNLTNVLNAKAEVSQLNGHTTDLNAHVDVFELKEDKNKKGAVNGYVPLNDIAKISSNFLIIVNDLITGGVTSLASAETVKLLKIQIDGINTLLTSDNINLDNIQEIVDAIEAVQTSLSTILVNDLTTGGVTKALTAEMGKTLKGLVDGLASDVPTATIRGRSAAGSGTVANLTAAQARAILNVADGAQVNVLPDWNATPLSLQRILNLPTQTNFNIYNQNKTNTVVLANTTKTNITVATTGLLSLPSRNINDSFVGRLFGSFNNAGVARTITVFFRIGTREVSMDITSTVTDIVPFTIEYKIDFPAATLGSVTGLLRLGNVVRVIDLDFTQAISGLEYNINATLSGGTLTVNSSLLHRNVN